MSKIQKVYYLCRIERNGAKHVTYEITYKSKSDREEKTTEEIRTTLNAWECKYWLFDTYCKRLDVAEVVSVKQITDI